MDTKSKTYLVLTGAGAGSFELGHAVVVRSVVKTDDCYDDGR